jgi:hypothetical protein
MAMSNDDPQKMEEIRKFSAIYGRFDCKRKPEKPLTLHEVFKQFCRERSSTIECTHQPSPPKNHLNDTLYHSHTICSPLQFSSFAQSHASKCLLLLITMGIKLYLGETICDAFF